MALTQEELLRQQQEKLAEISQQQASVPQQTAGYNIFKPAQPQQPVQQSQPAQTPPVTQPQVTIAPRTPITSTEELAAAMGYTSPQEEERMRKASVANRRIMAVADALRQIGNIYHTVNYAPSQQFNSPVVEEQARYERGKALRDRANQTYLTYQQAKAAQDAKARQWEQQYELNAANAASQHAYRQEQARIAGERAKNQKAYQEGSLALRDRLGTAQQEERARHNKVAERQGQQRIGIQSQNSKNAQAYREWKMSGGGGSGKQTTVHTRKGAYSKAGVTPTEVNNIYDQLYEWGKSKKSHYRDPKTNKIVEGKPYIDEGGLQINGSFLFGNNVSAHAKRQAVNKMLAEHDDAIAELERRGFRQSMPIMANDDASDSEWEEYAEDSEDENWDQYLDN